MLENEATEAMGDKDDWPVLLLMKSQFVMRNRLVYSGCICLTLFAEIRY